MSEPDLMADTSVWDIPGQPSPVDTIYVSLNEALGTTLDTSESSNVTAETKAYARALAALWRSNRKMLLQWDPAWMTDMMSRWETVFGINPAYTDSEADRRLVLQNKFRALAGQATLAATASSIMGASYVGIVYTSLGEAVPRWPGNGYEDLWSSNVSHILIRVQFTAGQTEAQLYQKIAKLVPAVDDLLPSWVSWDFGTYSENGTEGFWLDEPLGAGPPFKNLDMETFDA